MSASMANIVYNNKKPCWTQG